MKAAGTKKQEKAEKPAKKAAKEGLGSAKQQHLPARNRRKQRRELARKIQAQDVSLEVKHPDAAGIDIGNTAHYVAVPPARDREPVRRFGCETAGVKEMARWLKQCGVRTVAKQSTGVDWLPVDYIF